MKLKLIAEHKVENDMREHKNSKTNEPHTFDLNLSQMFDLRSSSKHIVLPSVPIYYTWNNLGQQYKNNKL